MTDNKYMTGDFLTEMAKLYNDSNYTEEFKDCLSRLIVGDKI